MNNKLEMIRKIVNNVLYFDDSSDYCAALWEVLALINDWDDDYCYNIKLEHIE